MCAHVCFCVCVQSYQCSRMCVLFFLMCLPSLPLYVCFQMCALAYLCCNMCVCICQCVLSHQCSHMCALICVFLYMFSSPVCFHFGALSYLCSCRECLWLRGQMSDVFEMSTGHCCARRWSLVAVCAKVTRGFRFLVVDLSVVLFDQFSCATQQLW